MSTTAITTPTDREIRIDRLVNAPRERVWRAFTHPKLIAQWWGRGNKLVIERMIPSRSKISAMVLQESSPHYCSILPRSATAC